MIRRASMPLLLAAVLCACSQTQHAATDVQSVVEAQTSPTLTTADTTFLNEAGQSGIAEVTLGQLARTHGSRAAVRDYGLRMVNDHTATLALFQNEAASGGDPDVKAFAARTVPKIQAHLDLVRRLGAKPPPVS